MDSKNQTVLSSVTSEDDSNSCITSTKTIPSNVFDPEANASVFLHTAVEEFNPSPKHEEQSDVHKFLNSFPTGYRFRPSDEDLIFYYLMKKAKNEQLPPNLIAEADVYKHSPGYLTEKYEENDYGVKEWYFFTPTLRDRRGQGPNRRAGDGYWKTTGSGIPVHDGNNIVGFKRKLFYFGGKPPRGVKTNWIMHEYRLNEPFLVYPSDTKSCDWVLYKIYEKGDKKESQSNNAADVGNVGEQSDELL